MVASRVRTNASKQTRAPRCPHCGSVLSNTGLSVSSRRRNLKPGARHMSTSAEGVGTSVSQTETNTHGAVL